MSAFLKLRGARPGVPAGVGRPGPARRALVVHRLPAAPGRALEPRRRRRPVRARGRRGERQRQAPLPGLPPFAGGAVGFFGYDCVRTVEPLGPPNPDAVGLPDLALMLTDALVASTTSSTRSRSSPTRTWTRRRRRRPRARARRDRRGARAARRPAAAARRRRRPEPAVRAQHAARGVRGDGRPDRRVRPRGRRVPGRAVAALVGPPTSTRSRSTAGCARSTRRRTCTSSTSRTSRSSAPRPSRSSP